MSRSRQDLKTGIEQLWATMRVPLEDEIANKRHWDADCVQRDFAPYLHSAVAEAVLDEHCHALPAFTPSAFAYFLKDYLLYSLGNPESEVAEHLIYRLHDTRWDEAYGRERLILLSREQRNLVADCCRWFEENLPDEESYLRELAEEAVLNWEAEPT